MWPIIIFIICVIASAIAGVRASRHLTIKTEKKWRREHFDTIVAGKTTPTEAAEWLTNNLLGKASVIPGDDRHFNLNLDDLSITWERYRDTLHQCLRLAWNDLNMRKPTIKEAAHGQKFIEREINRLTNLMLAHKISATHLAVDTEAVRRDYLNRCCEVLEEGLYRYPDRPFQELSAPRLMEILKEIWQDPDQERLQKWQDWVLAAKKRHAYRLLIRLREGRYFFPDSDERVTRLLRYLGKAGATPEDIGTTDQELEDLRGFRYKTKQNT